MAFNYFKCNHLMPQHFKGLRQALIEQRMDQLVRSELQDYNEL